MLLFNILNIPKNHLANFLGTYLKTKADFPKEKNIFYQFVIKNLT